MKKARIISTVLVDGPPTPRTPVSTTATEIKRKAINRYNAKQMPQLRFTLSNIKQSLCDRERADDVHDRQDAHHSQDTDEKQQTDLTERLCLCTLGVDPQGHEDDVLEQECRRQTNLQTTDKNHFWRSQNLPAVCRTNSSRNDSEDNTSGNLHATSKLAQRPAVRCDGVRPHEKNQRWQRSTAPRQRIRWSLLKQTVSTMSEKLGANNTGGRRKQPPSRSLLATHSCYESG